MAQIIRVTSEMSSDEEILVDCGCGGEFTVILDFTRSFDFADALVIFGHCYWQDPLAEIGGNQLLSVDGRVVVLTR